MTPAGRAGKAVALTREVRACFQRLKALGDAMHGGLGVTAAMRAVMESLHEAGEQTVPRIAAAKRVSRQHIQVIVNDLVAAGLAATRPNPADARSPLVALTAAGSAKFARMREREREVFDALARALARHDLDASLAALAALRGFLDRRLDEGGTHDAS